MGSAICYLQYSAIGKLKKGSYEYQVSFLRPGNLVLSTLRF